MTTHQWLQFVQKDRAFLHDLRVLADQNFPLRLSFPQVQSYHSDQLDQYFRLLRLFLAYQ